MRVSQRGYPGAKAVSPSDTVDLPRKPSHALHIGTGGTLTVIMAEDYVAGGTGPTTPFTVVAGETLYVEVSRVMATGTTASNITALYGAKVP